MAFIKTQVKTCTNVLVKAAHGVARESGWWAEFDELDNPKVVDWFIGSKLALIHSEISEGVEGHRKGLMDDHLPQHPMLTVELADAVIRIADLAGALNLDLGAALADKMEYNMTRPDHRPENRAKAGGKTY